VDLNRVSTGSSDLDRILGGGLERRMITQIYGEPGSGKSTLALMVAIATLKEGAGVVFFDTEGFSPDRFTQIAGGDESAADLATRLFLYEPIDFSQQGVMILDAEKIFLKKKIGLIILDSATALYRCEMERRGDALKVLGRQMIDLLSLARKYEIPALITNQVYMDITTNRFSGLGGTSLSHISKAIIRIERRDAKRRAVVVKHRSRPEGEYFDFVITGDGIQRC